MVLIGVFYATLSNFLTTNSFSDNQDDISIEMDEESETDKYRRLLRYVISNDKFVNLELVRSGHARAKTYFPDTSCQLTFNQVIVK